MLKLVSFIMPVYNVKQYVLESIESVLSQTYPNIELIIVDDASTDGTYELVAENYMLDERVKLFKNDVNSKIVVTLNKALSYAKGEYIARIDGDDIAHPDRVQRQIDYLEDNPEVDLVGCSLEGIDEFGNHLNYSYFPEDFSCLRKISKYSTPVSHIWLARKSVYDSLGGYRFSSVEDYDFLLRMLTRGMRFSNISDYIGMKIRIRSGNTVSIYGVKQRKAFNFVRKRYLERLKFGVEKVNPLDFEKIISNNRFAKMHQVSNRFSSLAIQSRSKTLKILFYGLSAILSPYQFQYLLYTIIRRLIISYKL